MNPARKSLLSVQVRPEILNPAQPVNEHNGSKFRQERPISFQTNSKFSLSLNSLTLDLELLLPNWLPNPYIFSRNKHQYSRCSDRSLPIWYHQHLSVRRRTTSTLIVRPVTLSLSVRIKMFMRSQNRAPRSPSSVSSMQIYVSISTIVCVPVLPYLF